METKYRIIEPNETFTDHSVDWPEQPNYDLIAGLIHPILREVRKAAWLEHVTILRPDFFPGDSIGTDMFVDDCGLLMNLPVNPIATRLYQANWLSKFPDSNPEDLSTIHGRAIVFSRVIWS